MHAYIGYVRNFRKPHGFDDGQISHEQLRTGDNFVENNLHEQ